MFLNNSSIAPLLQYAMYLLVFLGVGIGIYYIIYIGNRFVPADKEIEINWKKILQYLILVLVITVIVALFRTYPILGNMTWAIFLSVILAFLLNPIVNKLESFGIKRGYSMIITYLIIVGILVFLGIAIIPDLISQVTRFISNLPGSIKFVIDTIEERLVTWNINTELLHTAQTNINNSIADIAKNIPTWSTTIFERVQGSISSIVTLVLIPIITYYFVVDKDNIIKGVYNFIPNKYKNDSYYLYKEINFAMQEFIISRSLMALFIGFSTGIMLWAFGIPFALVIGILTTIMDVVPYVGPIIATAPALIFAFIISPVTFVWVAIFCWLLQWIEQNIVGPKLFSNSSGLHEVLILISIILGGGIFGVWGMILAVPAVVIVKILLRFVFMKLKGIQPKFNKPKTRRSSNVNPLLKFIKRK